MEAFTSSRFDIFRESKTGDNLGSKGETGKRRNTRDIFAGGETLRYRSSERIFEVKKRAGQFVILQSLDGLT